MLCLQLLTAVAAAVLTGICSVETSCLSFSFHVSDSQSLSPSLSGSLVVDCGHPGSPPNGVLSGDKFTFGSTARYSCLGGRQLKGESSRTCQLNGMWSAPMPFCSGNHFNLYWIYSLTSLSLRETDRWELWMKGKMWTTWCILHLASSMF